MLTDVSGETLRGELPYLWGVKSEPQRTGVAHIEKPLSQSPILLQSSTGFWEELASLLAAEEQTTSLVARIYELLSRVQRLGVILENQERVREYLLRFPDLMDVIPHAIHSVLHFLPESRLFLDVYCDPEVEDEYLILYVRLQNYDTSVIERIEAAEREYIDLLAEKKGWLQVTTDFRELEACVDGL